MLTTTDILYTIEEEDYNIKQLAKRLGAQLDQVEKILKELSEHNLIESNPQTGKIKLSQWLIDINKEMENIKPATGTVILPKNQEIKLQDITIGNFTDKDLELNLRLTAKQKEIAICETA